LAHSGGEQFGKANYKIGPRFILYYSLHFVIEGKVLFSYGDKQETLNQGDFFCLFPHQTHQYRIHPVGQPLKMFWLAFDGKQSAPLLNSIGLSSEMPCLRKKSTKEISGLVDHLANLFRKGNENLDLTVTIYCLFQHLTLLTQPVDSYCDESYWLHRCGKNAP
jgi:hypothetical protein